MKDRSAEVEAFIERIKVAGGSLSTSRRVEQRRETRGAAAMLKEGAGKADPAAREAFVARLDDVRAAGDLLKSTFATRAVTIDTPGFVFFFRRIPADDEQWNTQIAPMASQATMYLRSEGHNLIGEMAFFYFWRNDTGVRAVVDVDAQLTLNGLYGVTASAPLGTDKNEVWTNEAVVTACLVAGNMTESWWPQEAIDVGVQYEFDKPQAPSLPYDNPFESADLYIARYESAYLRYTSLVLEPGETMAARVALDCFGRVRAPYFGNFATFNFEMDEGAIISPYVQLTVKTGM